MGTTIEVIVCMEQAQNILRAVAAIKREHMPGSVRAVVEEAETSTKSGLYGIANTIGLHCGQQRRWNKQYAKASAPRGILCVRLKQEDK